MSAVTRTSCFLQSTSRTAHTNKCVVVAPRLSAKANCATLSLKSAFSSRSLSIKLQAPLRNVLTRAEVEAEVELDDEEEVDAPAPVAEAPTGSKLYVGNISWDTQSDDLREAFEEYGSIIDCTVITDPEGRSRGFGFVEFEDHEQAVSAITALNGAELDGRDIRVDYVLPKGTRPERRPQSNFNRQTGNRIYIGNLPWKMDEYDLRDTFEEYGTVIDARVITDKETGRSRGFGFVTMEESTEMQTAISNLDGAECEGRLLRVNEAESR